MNIILALVLASGAIQPHDPATVFLGETEAIVATIPPQPILADELGPMSRVCEGHIANSRYQGLRSQTAPRPIHRHDWLDPAASAATT